MGRFNYSTNAKTDIEDRALAHLQIVIGNKLKRGEPFFFTWREDLSMDDGRRAVWIHSDSKLSFTYRGSRAPTINRAWLSKLARLADATSGLYLVSEPPDDHRAEAAADVI
ncbi:MULTISPECIES: hypothetical protein [unclassified Microbacterium]|uniref:DUF7882 family protein n=1 Tax=unclassified Microbacterium TaxID=2609290 RepID=UPI00035FCB92|nr:MULTISPECIES: hypothetical protein [unclassified Microbacterium]SCY56221.1 hypothetical protein SAMN05216488_2308 [Microbacterium sp. LKL04]